MDGHFKGQKDTARIVFLYYKSSCLKNLHKQDVNAKQKCRSFTLASENIKSHEALGNQAGHQTDLPRDLSASPGNKRCFSFKHGGRDAGWEETVAKNPGACRLCEPLDLQGGQTRPLPRCNRGVPQVKPPGPARHPRGYHSLGSCGGLPGARGELPGPRRPPEGTGAAAEGSRGPRGASSGRLGEGGPGPRSASPTHPGLWPSVKAS